MENTVKETVQFFRSETNTLVTKIVAKLDGRTFLERLAAGLHVFLGRDLELILPEATIARISARYEKLRAVKHDPVAAETFAMNGSEDIIASSTAHDVPTTYSGEWPPPASSLSAGVTDEHEVSRMADEGMPHGDEH